MSALDLEHDIVRRRRSLTLLAYLWRLLLMIPLAFGLLLLAFGVFGLFVGSVIETGVGDQTSLLLTMYCLDVVYGFIVITMLVYIGMYMYRETHAPRSNDPLSPKLSALLESSLQKLCANCRVSRLSIKVLYQRLNSTANASVVSSGGVEYLVLPLGFFKVLRDEPPKAEALLAHELGHMEARDTGVYLLTTACAKVMLYASLPLNVAIALTIAFCFPIGAPRLPAVYTPDAAADFFWQALINIVALAVGYAILREFRHQSEFLADSFACLHSTVDGVSAYLTSANTDSAPFDIRALHPTIPARLRNVEKCRGLLAREGRRGFLPSAPFALPSKVILLTVVVFLFLGGVYWFLNRNYTNVPGNGIFGSIAPKARQRRRHGHLSEKALRIIAQQNANDPPPYSAPPPPRRDRTRGAPPDPHQLLRDLFSACLQGDSAAVSGLLQQGADAKSTDALGQPVLFAAINGGSVDVVNLLINAGADVNAADKNGNTALPLAAQLGRDNIVFVLLAARANVDAQDGTGRTALMNAAANGQSGTVRQLLDNHANVNLADQQGNTALSEASRAGSQDIVDLLRQAGEVN